MRMRRLSILALGVAAALSLCPRAVHAQGLPDAVKPEQIGRMLLAPGGWLLNWPDTTIGYLTGNATLTFEQRGIGLMVRIQNHTVNTGCEREVTVTPAGVTFDGCLERGIALRWTPDDPVFAFRGQSGARWYTLRPH